MKTVSTATFASVLAGLFVIAAGANAQRGRVFNSSASNVKMPSLMFGATQDAISKALGGAPNASTKDSGWSLNLILAKPVASEAVWAYDLTDPMPLAYIWLQSDTLAGGWLIGSPVKRTVRMYYHMGFDAEGKAIAGAMWYHGPTGPEGKFKGPSLDATRNELEIKESVKQRLASPPAYWTYSLTSTIAQHFDLQEARFSFWAPPLGAGEGKPCRVSGKGGNLVVHKALAVRGRDGTYGHTGWIMGQGGSGDSRWVTVGRGYPIQPAPEGRFGFATFALEQGPHLSDLVLFAWFGHGAEPQYGKIVPTTNDKAVKQDGVK